MAVEWERLGQPVFDRVVEALVHRLYDATAAVEVVNGRGGDGGIDIKVTSGARLRIFQLKYYCDGFAASSFKGRQKSIKSSFERAMAHSPYEWVLVVPCTVSPPERSFVQGLAAGRDVRVRIMDRAELDDRLAAHRDLTAHFTRDQLREAARDFNQERALLLGGTRDLGERIAALGARADTLDPHWAVDFSRRGDAVVHMLRAKHPRAHEVSPISIHLAGREGGLDAALSSAVTRSLGFGVAEEVVLPPEAVESLTISGPDWLAGRLTDVAVAWEPAGPAPGAGTVAEVVFLNEEREVTASYAGRLGGLGAGSIGRSVEVDLCGGRLRLLLPYEGAAMQMVFSGDLAGADPAEALKLLGLYRRVLAGGAFAVRTEGRTAASGYLSPGQDAAVVAQVEQLRLYAQDMEVLQRHCEQYFPLPEEISAAERVTVRAARLVIEGHCVALPFARTLTITLSGEDGPDLRSLLGGEPRSIRVVTGEYPVTVAGRGLDIGPVIVFHPRVTAEDGHAALAALDAGRAAGHRVVLRPADGEHYRICRRSGDDRPLAPVPLGLDGYPEPR
ncbi:hypothetical protein ACG5V6_24225 [Streptomyces chitinivorans]|uniref:Restriction endonuclease type IV Mrr domain-containing protein n=1 Tax=Streptomyces chitinivorans TaxID=1257027 RepID=A0ABW7HZZ1_9ACTN|nr:hypothetical protein [Streptomyces chitinivorans]MDH2412367.1 hypothetical protein [Streptomyces chitinivorans]